MASKVLASAKVATLYVRDVPERLYETLQSGWPGRYWQPWRAYLLQAR